jgi:cytochrome c oxidase subunit 3
MSTNSNTHGNHGHDAHGAHGTPGVHNPHAHAHHFNSMEEQIAAGKSGVWLFLVTEILMFGGLFVAYAIFRGLYPHMFQTGSAFLSIPMGALNTIVLITSSLFMALAVHYTHHNDNKKAVKYIYLTLICAAIFMVVKYFEYTHKIHEGLLPGPRFSTEHGAKEIAMFFGFYFVMTGLHGIHILIGVGLMLWLLKRYKNGDFTPENYMAVEGVGLYWHIVDIIWIYLFPLMYLI